MTRVLRTAASVAALSATLLATACGGGSSSASGGGTTPAAQGSNARGAFEACLKQHGVTLANGGRRSPGQGGGGGGGGFFGQSANPQLRQAMQACRSLMPNGGFRGVNPQELAAFRTCMQSHGVALSTARPTAFPSRPTAGATPGGPGTPGAFRGEGGALRGLNTEDPKVAAALKVCRALIPTPSAAPAPSPS